MSGIFYNARYGFYNVSFFDRTVGGDASNMQLSNLYIDGQDLRLLGDNEPWVGTAADVFGQLQLPLHSGRILGTTGQVLMSVMGLGVAMLSITGLVIWWRKRRARQARRPPPPAAHARNRLA
jgi:LPXTG-motif cell wall-anchored protein